jgi:adenylate cyclase
LTKKISKILAGLILSFCITIFALLFFQSSLFELTNLKLTHSLYHDREVTDEIVIIAIDNKSLAPTAQGGLDQLGNWPYDYYAQALSNVNHEDPEVVMLDMVFSEETSFLPLETISEIAKNNLSSDEFFISIIEHLASPSPSDTSLVNVMSEINNLFLAKWTSGEPILENEIFVFPSSSGPAQIFAAESETAYININTSDNRTIYTIPELLSVHGEVEKHMDIQIAERFLGQEITDIPTQNGFSLINYAQKSNSYPMYSFVDVYNGTFEANTFKNKIVLMGVTGTLHQDFFFTPIDSETPMAGVEVHANSIQTLLDQEFLKYQDTVPFVTQVSLIVLISVFAFLYLPIWGGLLLLIAEIAAFPFYAQMRFDNGVIINLIWPVFAMVASYLLAMAYRNFTEFHEKRKLRNAFAHYVSPELVNQITASGDDLELGGERRVMTTLFLDIENFTGLSEKLEPHEVVKAINIYFDAFAKEIMAHGGTVDKFEGDAIMALFGAPLKTEDHALKACQTAMAIRSRIAGLNEETGHDLNVRVGIATGECIVGNMGSEDRFDYTAMGDTVNTASRLEGGNKFYGTRTLVNAGTMEGAQEHLFFRRIDRVKLKGKDVAIDIYEVMGANEAVSEEGKLFVNEWHSALEYYRNQDWDGVEEKIRKLLEKMPNDGPALSYLERIEKLRNNPPEEWDGTWTFTSK